MNEFGSWLLLGAMAVLGVIGMLMAARGDGTFAIVGWLLVAIGVIVGIGLVRRIANRAFGGH